MKIDIERLRADMKEECLAAYYCGGYGAALMESFDIEKASPEELLKLARMQGINLSRYESGK